MSSKSTVHRANPTKRKDNTRRRNTIQRNVLSGGSTPNSADMQKRLGNQGTQAWLTEQQNQFISRQPQDNKSVRLALKENAK